MTSDESAVGEATRAPRYVIKSTRGYYARVKQWTHKSDEAQRFASPASAASYAFIVLQLPDADYAVEEVA